ncbi:MAG TPA: hypothetical protein VK588_04820 [Chitinophagaceae bacterium]|nr:hypothetical protein [Chitinophagaceae bacterium]
MATLSNVYVTFGVPSYATGNQWDGDDILFAELRIFNNDGIKYVGTAAPEVRHQPIGAGHAIYINIAFTPNDLRKITPDNVYEMEIYLTATKGVGDGKPGNTCTFRTEAVLTFSDGRKLSTGYNDPARQITTDIGGSTSLLFRKAGFHNAPTLIEPIG